MKYFAKYLPVEGTIHRDDFFLKPDGRISQCKKVFKTSPVEVINYNGEGYIESDLKRVQLFLCSRDIQVGDKIRSSVYCDTVGHGLKYDGVHRGHNVSIELEVISFNQGYYKSKILVKEGFLVPPECTFKVIGPISPEAIWVKEGDEFDEEKWILWNDDLDVQIEKKWVGHEEVAYTKIKCSACGHFH